MASRRMVLVWVACLSGTTLLVVLVGALIPGMLPDLMVYRVGGTAWLDGIPLYTTEFPYRLPFTYPPVSAVLFSVLGVLPWAAAIAALSLAGLLALSLTTMLVAPAHRRMAFAAVAVALGLALEPVRDTLTLGQVNLILMGLVAFDCLAPRTRYPRGMLIGLAAAVKLTPAIFVLFFLARRRYAPVGTAAATFAGVTALGLLLAPTDSIRYWTTALFDADRVGGAAFATNQSLRAALVRFDLDPTVMQACWLVLVAVVLTLAWFGARRMADRVIALLVVVAAGLLVSPVSWSHHWVWIVPAVVVAGTRVARRRQAALLVALVAVFAAGQRFLPHADDREFAWTWWQHVIGNSYLLVGLGFLVWSVVRKPAPVVLTVPAHVAEPAALRATAPRSPA
jgi:alpha-1,2-mannosyltransferase